MKNNWGYGKREPTKFDTKFSIGFTIVMLIILGALLITFR